MSYDEEESGKPKKQIGLKNTKPSMFDGKPKKPTPLQFENSIREKENSLAEQANDIVGSSAALVSLFTDKTLAANKSPFQSSHENDIINNFLSICGKIDENENGQFINEGSLTAIGLLIKLSLSQKNKINELEFFIKNLENNIAELKKSSAIYGSAFSKDGPTNFGE